jgi:2-oxoisovalerate dehydrogenase E1 component alpha subunit
MPNPAVPGSNRPPLALYVPQPPARPGQVPDFSALPFPPAGAAPGPTMTRPPTGCATWPMG